MWKSLSTGKNPRTKPNDGLFDALARVNRNNLTWCGVIQLGIIEKIENIQRGFTSKISRVENLNYYDRLRKGGICSLKRRRCRNEAIWLCKMISGISINIF